MRKINRKNRQEIEVAKDHPLEEVFDLEEGSTLVPQTVVNSEVTEYEQYDKKDTEIESQFQEVYDLALTAFEQQQEESEDIDPKYKARNAEVAVQFLSTALNAAQAKANLKTHKEKLGLASKKAGKSAVTNNNLLVTNRNDLLKLFRQESKHIDGETDDKG